MDTFLTDADIEKARQRLADRGDITLSATDDATSSSDEEFEEMLKPDPGVVKYKTLKKAAERAAAAAAAEETKEQEYVYINGMRQVEISNSGRHLW